MHSRAGRTEMLHAQQGGLHYLTHLFGTPNAHPQKKVGEMRLPWCTTVRSTAPLYLISHCTSSSLQAP